MQRAKAIITLFVLSPVLAEFLSASSPASDFFRPTLFFFLLFVGYGLPALLIREFAVRGRLGPAGIFLLGAGYGIYNEGLLAKTIIQSQNLPIAEYNNYGYFAGISFPWLTAICLWQSLAAVLFPIVFTHHLFPDEREEPWLNKKLALLLAAALLVIGSLSLLDRARLGGTPRQLLILWVVMLCCAALAKMLGRRSELRGAATSFSWKPVLLGASVMYAFMALVLLAGRKINLLLFLLLISLVVAAYIYILSSRGWLDTTALTLLGIGFYSQFTLLGMVVRLLQNAAPVQALITFLLAEAIFCWCVWKTRASLLRGQTV